MKTSILLAILLFAINSNAQQSLKDLLYSGRLKSDTGSVVKKDDDLSTKIDSTAKKRADSIKAKMKADAAMDSSITTTDIQNNPGSTTAASTSIEGKDNNTIWKEYMDNVVSILKEEILPSSKIKSGTYYILVVYEIDTDGQVAVTSVASTPDNSYLTEQIERRLKLTAPEMHAELNAYGNPRKAVKRYNFTITKT